MNEKRITKLAFVIVVISFLASTFVSLWSLHVMSQHNQRELSKVLTAQIYDVIAGELSDPIFVAKTMANDSFLKETLRDETSDSEDVVTAQMKKYLAGIQNGLDYEAAFVVSNSTGRYYTPDGVNKIIDPEHTEYDRWYSRFIDSGRDYDLDVDNDEFSQDAWTVFVNSRMNDDTGKLLGVCGVGVRMTGSQDLIRNLEKDYNVRIRLIDENHLVQVDIDENNIENAYLNEIDLKDIASNEYRYQKLGHNRIAVTRYIDSLGWYLVVQSDGANERSQFLNVILLNIVMFLLIMLVMAVSIRVIAKRTISLSNASLKDQPTGLYNRRAFEEEKTRLQNKGLEKDFVYLIADVNGLKTANDTIGHAAGDELIKGAAETLKKCFGKYGEIYRIGGDEFAVMMHISKEELEQQIKRFEEETSSWRGEQIDELAVSCGYADAKEFPSENISELSEIADERMYAAKEAYYQSSGKDRRKH